MISAQQIAIMDQLTCTVRDSCATVTGSLYVSNLYNCMYICLQYLNKHDVRGPTSTYLNFVLDVDIWSVAFRNYIFLTKWTCINVSIPGHTCEQCGQNRLSAWACCNNVPLRPKEYRSLRIVNYSTIPLPIICLIWAGCLSGLNLFVVSLFVCRTFELLSCVVFVWGSPIERCRI